MDVRDAIKGQYRAGLLMLKECIELCPDALWSSGIHPRTYWRIVYHALYYTHFYMMPSNDQFTPWVNHCWHGRLLWDDDEEGVPPNETTYGQAEMVSYAEFILSNVDEWVDRLDLESSESGFPWYPIPKLDHQLVNIRHLGIHIGQLQEHLYELGLDPDWIGKR